MTMPTSTADINLEPMIVDNTYVGVFADVRDGLRMHHYLVGYRASSQLGKDDIWYCKEKFPATTVTLNEGDTQRVLEQYHLKKLVRKAWRDLNRNGRL